MAPPACMLKADSSTTVSGDRGPTPRFSTMTWPRPTTRSLEALMAPKISQGRGREGGGGIRGRQDRAAEDPLGPHEALEGVDGLAVGGARVVGASQVVEDLGAARH